jgi:hypothetical protein
LTAELCFFYSSHNSKHNFDSARLLILIAFGNIVDMKAELTEQNGSTETGWPTVLRIAKGDEFQQSFAVAQLAVKLCEIKMANSKAPLEKENLDPKNFLKEAWNLIESAREHVARPQTEIEYLVEQGGGSDALATVFERESRAELIPFKKLCDPERKPGDVEPIGDISWPVYRSKKRFEEMFSRYANSQSKKWRATEGRDLERWIKGKAAPDKFPPLTEVGYGTIEKRKEVAERWLRGERVDGFPRFSVPGYDSEDKRAEAASKWVNGKAVPECFPPFTKKDSIKQRAEIMKDQLGIDFLSTTLRQDLVKWNERNWTSMLQKWREDGIPPEDFLPFHNFRKKVRQVRLKNLPTRSRKAKTK